MKFKESDFVMVDHPDYPELQGIARVDGVSPQGKIIFIHLYKDDTKGIAHIDFLRHASEEEIKAASKS
ncbi:hypothetical protein [Bacillus cereus group sp. BfR-BA-01700]|uniref:hypothetical protein n=1 Tax=Bacillus cereus group sp. BfR-BA-01700 TaxID=3094884 RepID=UPI0029C34065|nr:hypothetical protein [Bacillus cereus group sp. BfR-BA-01700]MDX5841051.1 hypothetical protein [Bacillus cereus group sp. BfR-BA-01700]HDR7242582.1 hypothetical protein [Bacillus mobilis]